MTFEPCFPEEGRNVFKAGSIAASSSIKSWSSSSSPLGFHRGEYMGGNSTVIIVMSSAWYRVDFDPGLRDSVLV